MMLFHDKNYNKNAGTIQTNSFYFVYKTDNLKIYNRTDLETYRKTVLNEHQ